MKQLISLLFKAYIMLIRTPINGVSCILKYPEQYLSLSTWTKRHPQIPKKRYRRGPQSMFFDRTALLNTRWQLLTVSQIAEGLMLLTILTFSAQHIIFIRQMR